MQWPAAPNVGFVYPKAVALSSSGDDIYVCGEINGVATFGSFVIPDEGGIHPFVVKVAADDGAVKWAWGPNNYGTASRSPSTPTTTSIPLGSFATR